LGSVERLVARVKAAIDEGYEIAKKFSRRSLRGSLEAHLNDFSNEVSSIEERIKKEEMNGNYEVIDRIAAQSLVDSTENSLIWNITDCLMSRQTFHVLLTSKIEERLGLSPNENIDESVEIKVPSDFNPQSSALNTEDQKSKPVCKTEISIKDLKALAGEMRGVMNKGATLIGKEVIDFDMALKWTKKLVNKISDEYIFPKSVKKINFFHLDESDNPELCISSIRHEIEGIGINVEPTED